MSRKLPSLASASLGSPILLELHWGVFGYAWRCRRLSRYVQVYIVSWSDITNRYWAPDLSDFRKDRQIDSPNAFCVLCTLTTSLSVRSGKRCLHLCRTIIKVNTVVARDIHAVTQSLDVFTYINDSSQSYNLQRVCEGGGRLFFLVRTTCNTSGKCVQGNQSSSACSTSLIIVTLQTSFISCYLSTSEQLS